MAIIGTYSNGTASAYEYEGFEELLSQLVDNNDNQIDAVNVRNSVYTLWKKIQNVSDSNEIKYISATLSTGGSYSCSSTYNLTSYDKESLYLVKFSSTNSSSGVSLNIDNVGYKDVKKTSGQSLSTISANDISTNYTYLVTWNGLEFELLDPSANGGSGLNNKYYISLTETINVPDSTQYWIYGDLTNEGTFNNNGHTVVVNGSFSNSGTFEENGTLSILSFAEINGLGETNYVPRWITPYMLTASSSIYDDGSHVMIDAKTFSVDAAIVIPNGASSGYILTSDVEGVATWQQGVRKFTNTYTFQQNQAVYIDHNLNTEDILVQFWNDDIGSAFTPDFQILNANQISATSSNDVNNGRVVIIG
jgi:hypothetical protein